MDDLLLDTCALIWLARGTELSDDARKAIERQLLRTSPISVWEIGNLIRKGRLFLAKPPAIWFQETCFRMFAVPTDLSVEVLAASCTLPGHPPNDPADRIIIATARENDMTIVTRDRLILDYARAGHVRAVAC